MSRLLRRLAQVLVALGIVTGLGVATAGAASAHGIGEYACNYVDGRFNACLLVTNLGAGQYHVRIGIDVTMTQQEAQAHIDAPGREFTATLYGDDGPSTRQYLASPYMTSVTAWSGGLSAEWEITVPSSWLNEDSGVDELVGRILFFNSPGQYQTYETGQVVGAF